MRLSIVFLATFFTQASGSISANGPFAHNVNGEIVCDEVVEYVGIYMDENGENRHESSYTCVVDPFYTETGSKYIELDLLNVAPMFEENRKEANTAGKTRLCIKGSTVAGSTIVLPSNEEPDSITCKPGIFENQSEQQCWAPSLNWHPTPADSLSVRRKKHHSRNLAVNQTGNRSILVFRITTSTNGSPSASSADVSNQVFGPVGLFVIFLGFNGV